MLHGVLAVPGRIERLVPDALQIGRLAAGPAGADQQVAAVLEHQRGQVRIVAAARSPRCAGRSGCSAAGCGRGRARRGGTGPGDRPRGRGWMLRPRFAAAWADNFSRRRVAGSAGNVAEVLEVRGGHEPDRQRIGPRDAKSVVLGGQLSALGRRPGRGSRSGCRRSSTWPRSTRVPRLPVWSADSLCGLFSRTRQSSWPGLSARERAPR